MKMNMNMNFKLTSTSWLAYMYWVLLSFLLLSSQIQQTDGKLGTSNLNNKQQELEDENDNTLRHHNPAEAFPRLHLRDDKQQLEDRNLQDLTYYGGKPGAEFIPLGLCEGDCDTDDDCDIGLVCFQREPRVPVPGCSGSDNSRNDYCIRDPNLQSTPQPSPNPTPQPSPKPSPGPSQGPSAKPTPHPSTRPSPKPSVTPTRKPSVTPTRKPSHGPTAAPFNPPTPIDPIEATKNVALVGNNGRPERGFPLMECEGDCDTNDECDQGLVCFTRAAYEPVPGCLGGENDPRSADYCVRAEYVGPQPTPRPTTEPPVPMPTAPTNPSPTAPQPTIPLATMETMIVGNNGRPGSRFPLQQCQGDCDSDAECAEGLICYDATPGVPVPGCLGIPSNGDYCIVDPGPMPTANAATKQPTNKPSTNPTRKPTTPAPTRKPTATSTNKPTPHPSPGPSAKPTPQPSAKPSPKPTTHPTPAPIPFKELETVGRGNPWAYPLKHCQGDCDSDSDCEGPLICHQRDAREAVPGCLGGLDDNSRTDYCVYPPTPSPTPYPTPFPTTPKPTNKPTNKPTVTPTRRPTKAPSPNPTKRPTTMPVSWPTAKPTNDPTRTPTRMPSKAPISTDAPTKGPTPLPTTAKPSPAPTPIPVPAPFHNVRLRLYWEQGYTWQESTAEKFWCMMADYRGKPGTGRCWHGENTAPCARDQLYVADCNSDRRQRFSIMFVTHDQVMIKVARDNRCFQRNGQLIQLRACDPTNALQRWFSRRGAFIQRRFELSNPTLPEYCATQEHHPKPGEQVYLEPCILARHPVHQTNFWTRF